MDICEYYNIPSNGTFIIGNKYTWNHIIDGISISDEQRNQIIFSEIKWLWYFKKV